ncbi:MAG TPA: malto-oligosyltrehalose trehalohydrolase [Solirubrobacteraceae bacterium]|nr:malto-oligosyltrehalose trehalohydrolase [Solirubrobacteraceae bacterium]
MSEPAYPWQQPLGALPSARNATAFRVWAPRLGRVVLRAGGREHELTEAGYGIWEAELPVGPGADYAYLLDGVELPDPCSRWQPAGLRGPSRVLDVAAFEWTDEGFQAPQLRDLVVYELHVGTFTADGTFEAAIPHLRGLRELGVTAVELMPVAEFPGAHGWGYDGVYLSAAHSAYGGPLGLQRLVDAAHREGLAVLLDVVYNHLGASGAMAMEAFGPYFTERHETTWGRAINFDDADSDPVREWVLQSAEQWIRDFHVDGLRLDAVHALLDSSPTHLVQELCGRVHAIEPRALVIAESGLNEPRVVRSHERGGWGCDAVWADDFHHALRVLLTGDRDGYYAEFGDVGQLAKAFRRPHVHDGTYSSFRRRRFGARADDVPPERFVVFAQNHDQVGNRALGDRLPVRARPLAALCTLLSPFTPMLFMGEEHGERHPFRFFSDHIDEEIAVATREGRRREFAAFARFAGEEVPDPQDPETFLASKLSREGEPAGLRDLYGRLLAARRELPPGDAAPVEYNEHQGWLRVGRGPYAVLANFSRRPAHVPVDHPVEVVLATHHATVEPGHVVLPPLAGALTR